RGVTASGGPSQRVVGAPGADAARGPAARPGDERFGRPDRGVRGPRPRAGNTSVAGTPALARPVGGTWTALASPESDNAEWLLRDVVNRFLRNGVAVGFTVASGGDHHVMIQRMRSAIQNAYASFDRDDQRRGSLRDLSDRLYHAVVDALPQSGVPPRGPTG